MEFIIQRDNLNFKSGYEVIIDLMEGDADGFSKLNIGTFPEKDLDLVEHLISTLDEVSGQYLHGMGGDDRYWGVNFEIWFQEGNIDNFIKMSKEDLVENLENEFEYHCDELMENFEPDEALDEDYAVDSFYEKMQNEFKSGFYQRIYKYGKYWGQEPYCDGHLSYDGYTIVYHENGIEYPVKTR